VQNDCKNLVHLNLRGTQVSDAGVAHCKDCKNLEFLGMRGNTKVGDARLAHFKECEHLSILDLQDCTRVTDAALVHFKGWKNLRLVFLENTQVSDAGLGHLKDCNSLGHLLLHGTKVTAAGIDRLRKALPKCEIEWDGGVIDPMAAVPPPATTIDARWIRLVPPGRHDASFLAVPVASGATSRATGWPGAPRPG
jgi:hypothetical protein